MPSDIFKDGWFKRLETWVECIHCERVFKLGDAVWIALPNDPVLAGMWCCPYYPECNGTLIDFVPTRRRPDVRRSNHLARALSRESAGARRH